MKPSAEHVLVMSTLTFEHISGRGSEQDKERLQTQKEKGTLVLVDAVEDYKFFSMRKSDLKGLNNDGKAKGV
jgi:type I site-specific restriction endonuclease